MLKKLIKFSLAVDVAIVLAALVARFTIPSEGDEHSDEFRRVAIMGGERFSSRTAALRHGTVVAVMAGVELDLTGAHLTPGAELTVFALWGGVEARVPPKWRVVGDTTGVLGEVRMALEGQGDLPSDAPTLIVNARAVMGGVQITNQARTPIH